MDNPEMYVIYTQERDGKKRRMHTVPRNKAEITYNNVMRRYSDNDIEIGMMSLRKWDMLPDNEIDLEREKMQ